MFLVNSRLGLVCATVSSSGREVLHPTAVVLLPKLRTQFAEFLNQGSLDRLRMFYVSTCVGLGYGHLDHSLEAFLGSRGSLASPERLGVVPQDDDPRISLEVSLRTCPRTTIAWVELPSCVPPSLAYYQVGR